MHYSYTGSKHQQTPHRITLVFNDLSFYFSNHLLYSTDTCGYAKIYKRRKGSKRWTIVPIMKTMGTRCQPPCEKKKKKKKREESERIIKIAHVFPQKFQ